MESYDVEEFWLIGQDSERNYDDIIELLAQNMEGVWRKQQRDIVSTEAWTEHLINIVIGIVGGGVQLGPLGTVATTGLLCQPRVIMMMEKVVEWLAGETEVLRTNLLQCRFVHHKPHMLPGSETGPPRLEASH
jgi:hypothetical protein